MSVEYSLFHGASAEIRYRGISAGTSATLAISLWTMRMVPLAECEAESSRKRFAKRQ